MGLFHVSEAGARGDGGAGGESEWFCGLAESRHWSLGTYRNQKWNVGGKFVGTCH